MGDLYKSCTLIERCCCDSSWHLDRGKMLSFSRRCQSSWKFGARMFSRILPQKRAFCQLPLRRQPPGADGHVYHLSVKNKKRVLVGSMSHINCLMHCTLIKRLHLGSISKRNHLQKCKLAVLFLFMKKKKHNEETAFISLKT